MRLRTVHVARTEGPDHPAIIVGNADGVFDETKKFCGYTHCRGECGLPALVLREPPRPEHGEVGFRELKTHSNMVACGPVFQAFRVKWEGEKVFLPDEDYENLRKMMWW